MSSKIKGGGRVVISEESQTALIDLLLTIENETANGDDCPSIADLSLHDKKRTRKQFLKKLVRRHERMQLRQKHDAHSQSKDQSAIAESHVSYISTNPNVRIELAEAIFAKEKKKIKDDKGKSKKKGADDSLFKIGTKKVIVVPRATSISELLKLSQSKLKLKKKPVCVFLQPSAAMSFELKNNLETINDGTVIHVSVSPLPVDKHSSDDEAEESADKETDAVDPLESVKRAYERQEMYRQPKQCERINEDVNETKRNEHAVTRSKLPVASQKQFILDNISNNNVVILSGSTGSGKSTQVPQFLLESQEHCDPKRPYIVVTQPRRVAAISLAQRVASERGCPPPGCKGSSVGYTVRLDNQVDLRSCRIVYMTIGILLRMLVQHQPHREGEIFDDDVAPPISIDTISHLIIDEVHERDVNTDFALTLLKGIMASKSSPNMPRLILMSATTSSELFVAYFTIPNKVSPVSIEIQGRTFPVDIKWLDDCEKFTGKHLMIRQQSSNGVISMSNSDTVERSKAVALSPRANDRIDNIFIRELLTKIIKQEKSDAGSILVFLPGLGEINALARCLSDNDAITADSNVCSILTLHSTTPKADQLRVFQPMSRFKVVLSTNIAETSLTIPDITHVIDTCLVKESRYNPESRIKELITVFCSHASMTQRSGRAGRTSHGVCWRLCSEKFAEDKLLSHTPPEIVRTPLDELILQICLLYEQRRDAFKNSDGTRDASQFAAGVKPVKFLSSTPTPPPEQNHMQACQHLLEVDALTIIDTGDTEDPKNWMFRLTPLGYHLSRLPMDAKVGKLLIVGCIMGCLDNALTIAAALSCSKSIFLRSSQNRPLDAACCEARDSLIENGFGGRNWRGGTVKGDLIAVIAVHRAWVKQTNGNKNKFCRDHAIDRFAIGELHYLRSQFYALVMDSGLAFSGNPHGGDDDSSIANEDALLTSCCIVAGLYPNICTLVRPSKTGPKIGKLLTKENDACRPSSDSFQRNRVKNATETGKDALAVFHSKHRTFGTHDGKRPPETFLSEVNFISKFALLLFGGKLELVNNALIVDGWLKFKVGRDCDKNKGGDVGNAVLILSLRNLMDNLILEHVHETFSQQEGRSKTTARHTRIIDLVRKLIAEET